MSTGRWLLAGLLLAAAGAFAQPTGGPKTPAPPGSDEGAPAVTPAPRLPTVEAMRLAVPRPVQAATAALGLGRQRLALVVGLGTVGDARVVDSAPRDVQAVAAALRAGGFVVMLREDVSGRELRAALAEFRQRLASDGIGFIYLTGLGAQLDGHNLVLPRDTPLAAAEPLPLAERLRRHGVPLADAVQALLGPEGSPRLLVVDAAWRHPALAALPQRGLGAERLPPGVMALWSEALDRVQEVPAVAPLPVPSPKDPREIAATRFAATLAAALVSPRITAPEALRLTRRALFHASDGELEAWLGGDTDGREEFAEASLLDGLLPRTPEEVAREAARQFARSAGRSGGATAVAQAAPSSVVGAAEPLADGAATATPAAPAPSNESRSGTPQAPSPAGALGTAAGAVATVASVATVAAGVQVAQAAAAGTATTVVGGVGSALGTAAALAARPSGGAAAPATAPGAVPADGAPAAPVTTMPTPTPGAAAATGAALPALPLASVAAQAGGNDAAPAPVAAAPAAAMPRPTDGRTQRLAEGGERPLFVPRRNAYGHAQGDTYTWAAQDLWRERTLGEQVTAIEEVLGDGQLLANGQRLLLDAEGRVRRQQLPDGTVREFEPAEALWWAGAERGQTRRVRFRETLRRGDEVLGRATWEGSAGVGRAQPVHTPAGTFEALPIESSGWTTRTGAGSGTESVAFSRTVWFAPKLGQPVAIDIVERDRSGRLLRHERVELTHAQSARHTP